MALSKKDKEQKESMDQVEAAAKKTQDAAKKTQDAETKSRSKAEGITKKATKTAVDASEESGEEVAIQLAKGMTIMNKHHTHTLRCHETGTIFRAGQPVMLENKPSSWMQRQYEAGMFEIR